MRVSAEGREVEKNRADIRKFADEHRFGPVEWREENISGATDWEKRELARVLEELQPGDMIVAPEISRYARSTLQVLEFMQAAKLKGVAVCTIKENFCLNGTLEAEVAARVFGLAATIERSLISAWTKEGLRAVRKQSKRLGRPKGKGKSKLDQHGSEIIALPKNGSPKSFVAKRYKCAEPTLINLLNKSGMTSSRSRRGRISHGKRIKTTDGRLHPGEHIRPGRGG